MTNPRLFHIERPCNDKFDENVEILKGHKSTVGKGDIACYKQFLLFPQCFKRLVPQTCKDKGLFGKGLTLSQTSPCFYESTLQVLKTLEKG